MNNCSSIISAISVLVLATIYSPAQSSQTDTRESSVLKPRSTAERVCYDSPTAQPRVNSAKSLARVPKPVPESLRTPKQKDVLGWQDARWGMTDADIVKTFGASLKKLPQRKFLTHWYEDYIIPNFKLNLENFTVHFQMDPQTNRLTQILITFDQEVSISPRNDVFLGLEELLTQKYGAPGFKKDETERYILSRSREWMFPTTIIELSYSYHKTISVNSLCIRYFPAGATEANKL